MAQLIYRLFVVLICCPLSAWATHQVGGQLTMRAVGDVPGHFTITVTNYFEDNNRAAAVLSATIGVFRKRDNVQMTTIFAPESGRRSSIIYANSYCATQRNLNFITATYTADVQLSPGQYADSEGYYLSYQTRNRNGGINNLANPLQTGFTFYLEFPPLTTTGKYIHNSSPQFVPVNGEYVCMGEAFTFAFGGIDPDGDELRYSLVTPLNAKNNSATAAAPYPDVFFAAGYSATNAIPGSPALSVNPQTGQLSVTASETGLFVFAVRVDEYRNGQKIGEVRRDFQLLVVDCPSTQKPDPAAQIKDLPVTATKTTLCPGESATLVSTINSNWNYQWQRDGVNLSNATSSSLVVTEQGEYTVQVSLKNACTQVGSTQSLTIISLNSKPTLTATGQLCATDGTASLHVSDVPDVSYQWLRDGKLIAGAFLDSLQTTQPGTFQAVLTHLTLGCQVTSDQLKLARAPAVLATLKSASGFDRICPDDPLVLVADGGLVYAWSLNGAPIAGLAEPLYTTRTTGTYSLTATDANGCKGSPPPISISAVPPVTPTLDSLPPFCGTNAPVYSLVGKPAGGLFNGPGMVAAVFTPASAGIGRHTIIYSVRPAPECSPVSVSQVAVVHPIPTINLPEELLTFRGNTLTLQPELTGDPTVFRWSPGTYLTSTQTPVAPIESIQKSITYTLWIENAGHCTATDSIAISVVDHLYIPDAFTPNGDGKNDRWLPINREAYPDIDITVFNRWGTVIFHTVGPDQEGFDGKLNGTDVPNGVYTYVVRPDPKLPPMQGRLLLIR